MSKSQSKLKLKKFLGDTALTFTFKTYDDGEWVAQCDQIPGLATGGKNDDLAVVDSMIRDAILTSAQINPEYTDLLKFKTVVPKSVNIQTVGRSEPKFHFSNEREMGYGVTTA